MENGKVIPLSNEQSTHAFCDDASMGFTDLKPFTDLFSILIQIDQRLKQKEVKDNGEQQKSE